VAWLGRTRAHKEPPASTVNGEAEGASSGTPVERTSPGLAALFERLSRDGRHAILDLGAAGSEHLSIFSPFARRIRFAGLLPRPPECEAWAAALRRLPSNEEQPYDVVLAWDVLDRLDPGERPAVIERLAEITAPDARLYAVVDASGAATAHPVRFTLRSPDRVVQVPVGRTETAHPQLLPAHVERTLKPFEVQHAFTLRQGLREYVAAKRG
jgi:hypothetical protein